MLIVTRASPSWAEPGSQWVVRDHYWGGNREHFWQTPHTQPVASGPLLPPKRWTWSLCSQSQQIVSFKMVFMGLDVPVILPWVLSAQACVQLGKSGRPDHNNAVPPGVRASSAQTPRIRNHYSLIYWCKLNNIKDENGNYTLSTYWGLLLKFANIVFRHIGSKTCTFPEYNRKPVTRLIINAN